MDNIELKEFVDNVENYKLLYNWCSKKTVYEWFEQRVLTYQEIVDKYKNKLKSGKQNLFFIVFNNKPIGFVQIYKYDGTIYTGLNNFKNIYEYDIFIGEENMLSKGIGKLVISEVNYFIHSNYSSDCIVLRPFKRNIRAVKCYEKCGFITICEYVGKDTIGNPETILVQYKT